LSISTHNPPYNSNRQTIARNVSTLWQSGAIVVLYMKIRDTQNMCTVSHSICHFKFVRCLKVSHKQFLGNLFNSKTNFKVTKKVTLNKDQKK